MQPESGRHREPNGEPLLPPATTQWRPLAEAVQETALPLAPYFPVSEPAPQREVAADEAVENFPEDAFFYPEEPGAARAAESFSAIAPLDDAGEEEALVLLDAAIDDQDLDRRIAEEVARGLEQLAARLREAGLAALAPGSAEPVDTVLAAVLSGYVAARAR